MAYQSLYRRYRSQSFAEIKGQPHVTQALRTAVAEGRHGHAYLFSGPRGTGKTSTARVLAKALNCENLNDGEPCGTCQSCVDIEHGRSFDLHELDAASNNKVDDIRDLIAKVALGSPGRTKVYILDEVHMLTPGAENALLKTLEEPPPHVVFVLATTEPHKVVPTIRSRTQHFEFHLLPGDELAEHVRWIIADAGLSVDEAGIEYVLRQGGGSARDTLSALDLVAAAGGVPATSDVGYELAKAIGASDTAAALTSVQRALEGGREPRVIGEETLALLRDAFLSAMGAPLVHLNDASRTRANHLASTLGAATITRSLEHLGQALVDMRQAPDPRVPLEVTLLRLARREGNDVGALLQRIEALEQQIAALTAQRSDQERQRSDQERQRSDPSAALGAPIDTTTALPAMQQASAPSPRSAPAAPAPPPRRGPAAAARDVLAEPAPSPQPVAAPVQPAPPSTPTAVDGAPVSLPQLTEAFASGFLDDLEQRIRARFRLGHFVAVDGDVTTFAVPNAHVLPRCEEVRSDLEQALRRRFGRPLTVTLVVDPESTPPASQSARSSIASTTEEHIDVSDVGSLETAVDVASNSIDRLTRAFPGSTLVAPPPE